MANSPTDPIDKTHLGKVLEHHPEAGTYLGLAEGDDRWGTGGAEGDQAELARVDGGAGFGPRLERGDHRLVAFGVDAYRLIPHLGRLQVQPYAPFDGVTGSIVLDESNRVNRALEWAQFRHGRAQPLETEIPFP